MTFHWAVGGICACVWVCVCVCLSVVGRGCLTSVTWVCLVSFFLPSSLPLSLSFSFSFFLSFFFFLPFFLPPFLSFLSSLPSFLPSFHLSFFLPVLCQCHTHGIWKFLGQGLNMCHNCNHCSDNTRPLTCWAMRKLSLDTSYKWNHIICGLL